MTATARQVAAGKPERETCDTLAVWRSVTGQFAELARAAGGRLEAALPPDEALVDATEEALRLVLEVVLENALAYSPPPARIEVGARIQEGRVTLEVLDSGPGISAEERDLVFERWERGTSGRRSGKGGAGMGLYLARKKARELGGELEMRFPPEGGTLARVTLPLSHRAEETVS